MDDTKRPLGEAVTVIVQFEGSQILRAHVGISKDNVG